MAASHLPQRQAGSVVVDRLLAEAAEIRQRIRQGAFWPNTYEFDFAVSEVYRLEEAAEAALAELFNQLAT